MSRSVAAGPVRYSVSDLGDFTPQAISNSGAIAGESAFEPAVYDNGVVRRLGLLPGMTSGSAYGINDSGQVVGSGRVGTDGSGAEISHAFLYDRGVVRDLGTLPGRNASVARDINNVGQVVGFSSSTSDNSRHAFLYEGGAMRDLGTLAASGAGSSEAHAINDAGQIVGLANTDNRFDDASAFLFDNGMMTSVAGAFFEENLTYDVNDRGQMVGTSVSDGGFILLQAFLYDSRSRQMVPFGPSFDGDTVATAINNRGQAVGEWNGRAAIFDGETALDLNDLIPSGRGWELLHAGDINDRGQIIGYGVHDGINAAFLLTPNTPSAIPLPPAYWTGLSVMGVMAAQATRRRLKADHQRKGWNARCGHGQLSE